MTLEKRLSGVNVRLDDVHLQVFDHGDLGIEKLSGHQHVFQIRHRVMHSIGVAQAKLSTGAVSFSKSVIFFLVTVTDSRFFWQSYDCQSQLFGKLRLLVRCD